MKLFNQFALAVLVSAGFFFCHAAPAVAQVPSQVIHAADAGTVINLNVGDTIQFSLDENIPNTTPWVSPIVVWTSIAGSLLETGASVVYDFTQDPIVATAVNFNYSGVKSGQTILMFYKNGITSTTNMDGSTVPALTDPTHPMVTALTFIINVH